MPLSFPDDVARQIEAICGRYPNKQAACLPVLHLAQKSFGDLRDEVVQLVARTLELSEAHVHGVVTFYTMFHRKPVGKHTLMVCTNVSCMLKGGYGIMDTIEKKLGIAPGETTPDGLFTLVEEECLAACCDAPMMIVGDQYHLNLTPEKVEQTLDTLRRASGPGPSSSPSPSASPNANTTTGSSH